MLESVEQDQRNREQCILLPASRQEKYIVGLINEKECGHLCWCSSWFHKCQFAFELKGLRGSWPRKVNACILISLHTLLNFSGGSIRYRKDTKRRGLPLISVWWNTTKLLQSKMKLMWVGMKPFLVESFARWEEHFCLSKTSIWVSICVLISSDMIFLLPKWQSTESEVT